MFRGLIIAAVAIGVYAAWERGAVTCDIHRDRVREITGQFSRNLDGDPYVPPTVQEPRWTEQQSHGARYGATGDPTPLH
jgi:hypothetical protein